MKKISTGGLILSSRQVNETCDDMCVNSEEKNISKSLERVQELSFFVRLLFCSIPKILVLKSISQKRSNNPNRIQIPWIGRKKDY